jgi:hypothetical protein
MMPDRQLRRRLLHCVNAFAALAASVVVLGLLGARHGNLPALGPAMMPGHSAGATNATGSSSGMVSWELRP